MDDFAKALDQYDYQFEKGQIVRGRVDQHTSDGAFIDIGGKSSAFISLREISLENVTSIAEALPIDAEFDFLITRGQDAEGQVTLSLRQLLLQKAWENVREISESGKSVQLRVTGVNKGGVTGEVEGLKGFIPRSHLIEKNDLDSLIGQLLTATFIQIDQENNKLVLSQREIARANAISQLAVGKLLSGTVVKLQPYGVFVDCGGVTGLLHAKQVTGAFFNSPMTFFKVGQAIKVVVAEIDEYKNRISLSTKILEAHPGEILENFAEVMETAAERLKQAQGKTMDS
ncbi:MAG: 30S ribosomal protein S1 [Microcystis novacekii Mn_MB_F_20050700_S1]|uniref:30S ribosomal protein S1 n=1 Tax=Microcystis novacekii Mn_MB_F_20050700_S1D TaxID=2486266 RepID=A0A552IDU3_9CHRO|nr:MAG: 30S ribosomal protein S1 [Microcystis novacekii Mn_MB_F_20050700_S1]TRU81629.1 MAG: 30S ribosomal protein S1 [Microcystis novacekii Mn_MB_F_20050700_S1D]